MEASNPQTRPAESPDTIVFDAASGISLEEQQEILDGINAMAGERRLSGGGPESEAIAGARKKGFLFPLLVNACALALLGAGFFLLFFIQRQDDGDIRRVSAGLGYTERTLIQEIRRETSRRISEKETEIDGIRSMLSSADAEYRILLGSVETLTEEQKERAAYLLAMQEEYQDTLLVLQNEQARIIEDSRMQEAALRAQAEELVHDLSGQIAQSQAMLGSAMDELKRLGSERERAAMAESQMSGFYKVLGRQIDSGSLDEAAKNLDAMKLFLDTAFRGSRSMEEQKRNHLAAIAALEAAVSEAVSARAKATSAGTAPPAQGAGDEAAFKELAARYEALEAAASVLEQRAADQDKALAVLGSQGSDQSKAIAEYVTEIATLRTANSNQQQTLNRRDGEIADLRAESFAGAQQLSDLNNSVASLQSDLRAANGRATDNEAALAEQKRQYDALAVQRDDLQRQNTELRRQMADSLRQALLDLESDQ